MLLLRRVVGDSMLPSLRHGQMIVVHRFCRRLNVGDVVVIQHQGVEKIKRIGGLHKNRLFLVGDNSSASTDSRHFGWLPRGAVYAKVLWPKR